MAPQRKWFPRECQLTSQPDMETLGAEFGAVGVLTYEEIIALAKLGDPEGRCAVKWSILRRRSWSPSVRKTKDITGFIEAGLGLIKFREVTSEGFVADVLGWDSWNFRADPTAAARAKDYRVRKEEERAALADSGGASRDRHVTRHVTSRDTVNRDKDKGSKEPSTREATTVVFAEWLQSTDRDPSRYQLTTGRRGMIERAIKSHGLDDCLAAVRHIGADAWARGANDRQRRFDDIEHALKNAERIERWRDAKPRLSVVPAIPSREEAEAARTVGPLEQAAGW